MGHEIKITGTPITPLQWFDGPKLYVFDIEGECPSSLPKGLPAGGSIRYTIFATRKMVLRGQLSEEPEVFQNQRIVINGVPSLSVLDEVDIPLKFCQGELGLLCTDVATIAPPYTEEIIKIEKIIVPETYLETVPREEKTRPVLEFYQTRKHFDKPILVHRETMRLIDGYRRYYVAKQMGIKRVPIRYTDEFPPEPEARPPKKKKRAVKLNPAPPEPKEPVAPEVIEEVWVAEDGRCEGCGRPMDRKLANVARVDRQGEFVPENLHLVCIDCFMFNKKKETPFVQEEWRVLPNDLPRLAEKLDMEPAQSEIWVIAHVRQFGVLVREDRFNREFWLPGIGNFRLIKERQGPPHTLKVLYLSDQPALKIKPQARTRNLPKSKWIQPRQLKQQLNEEKTSPIPKTREGIEFKLTEKQKEILNIILRYQNESGEINITQAELAKELNCSPPTAGRRLNELENRNLIKKVKRGLYQLAVQGGSAAG